MESCLWSHGDPHGDVVFGLKLFVEATEGCHGGLEVTWVMGDENVPQPDGFLRILPLYGGQSSETERGYGPGAPELVIEITGATTSRDLGKKLELYQGMGVREYITVLVRPQQVIWRRLVRLKYKELAAGRGWLAALESVPGLWLIRWLCGPLEGPSVRRLKRD